MSDYIKLLRPKHWVKNLLVFSAIIFSGRIFESKSFLQILLGTISFCFISSAVYILNDIRDVDKDRNHEIKRFRPVAAGKISILHAWILEIVMLLLGFALSYYTAYGNYTAFLITIIYFFLNLFYSFGFKNIPILDIAILVSGFLFRVLYGALVINQTISSWLYLTVISLSFYLVLGKRRNELVKTENGTKETRTVLKFYNQKFLDKNMYCCLGIAIVFYSLWCVDPVTTKREWGNLLVWTVPLVMLILMKYSLCVESGSFADPVEVLFSNKSLLILIVLYCILVFLILYGNAILRVTRMI